MYPLEYLVDFACNFPLHRSTLHFTQRENCALWTKGYSDRAVDDPSHRDCSATIRRNFRGESTIKECITNHQLDSFPGLTPSCTKLLPPSTTTYKGHKKFVGKGTRSARSQAQDIRDARQELRYMNPTNHVATATDRKIGFFCYAALADANEGTVYTDLTGRFPTRSYVGSQYIFVCYAYQPNAVLIRAMTSREASDHVEAMTSACKYLKQQGFEPKLNILNNECSKLLQKYIESERVRTQMVEPDNHRVNAAERIIQTVKNHFAAG
ncbi:hypothetical protein ACHAWF_007401 [Thalassiosira exigua]